MSPLLLHGNTNQYNINGLLCILHRDVSHTDMLHPHFISCRGVWGQEATCPDPGILSVIFSPQLIIHFTEGSNGFIAEKTLLILYQGSRGGPLFSRGDVKLFPVGGHMLISLKTHIGTCYFPGGCPEPLSPSGSAHGQCHHNGTIFITVPLLTIIVRH